MANYLVTGGLGVVGSRFVQLMARSGHEVTVLDAAESKRNLWMESTLKAEFGDRISIIKARVEHTDFIPLLRSHDFMMHAAAHTGIPHSEQDPNDDWISNVDASRRILEDMRKSGTKTPVVMLSSVKPYKINDIPTRINGRRTEWTVEAFENGIDENKILEPDEPYAASKMAQTGLVMAYARSYDLPVTVLRCSNLYGDAPCHGPRHGWLTWFCISAALNIPINIQGTGFQTRDMLFSDDVASAVLSSFDNIKLLSGNVYNIGGGIPNTVSIIEAYDLLKSIANKSIMSYSSPGRKNEDMLFCTDHSRFTKSTGWNPKVGVIEGMKRIYGWASDNVEMIKSVYDILWLVYQLLFLLFEWVD